jgi:Bacterial Ig-like domain
MLLPLSVLLSVVGAYAWFSASGSGAGIAGTGNLNPPTAVSASATAGTVGVSWTASSTSGNAVTPQGYYVTRIRNSDSSTGAVCGSGPGSLLTGTSCSDTGVADGTYHYVVTAVYHSWTAASASSNDVTVVNDSTPPYVVSINRTDATPTNAGTVHWTVTFSENVTGADSSDFTLVGAGATGASITAVGGSGATRTVTASTGSDGNLGLNLMDDDSIKDGAGNPLGDSVGGTNGNFTGQTYVIDKTAPSVTINQAAGQVDPTGASTINFTVIFSESVSDFATGDVTLGGTAAATTATVTGSGTTYNVAVSGMTGPGTVIATIGAAKATDASGNGNTASTSTDNTVTYDTTPFVQSIDRATSSPTNATSLSWTVTFTRAVTGVDATDFQLAASGVSGASITGVTGSGTTYTVTASSGTGSGTLGLNLVDDNTIRDAQNNGSKLGGNSMGDGNFTGQVYTVDKIAPTVTVNQKSGQADPTNALPIVFTVTFSESVTGFDAGDLTRGGTSTGGTVSVTGSGASYEIAVTNPGSNLTNGSLVFSIAANKAQDLAGNNNAASTSTDNSVTYDTVAPTVTINQAGGQADPTNASPINFTVVFSESVSGFATGDVTLSGTAGATTATVTGAGTTYNVAVSGITAQGAVIATIGAGVASDTAGNGNAVSTSTDNSVTYDTVAPTVTINQAGTQADPTNASPINFTVVFSEPVSGFATGDVTLAGTAGATTATVTGSGTTYNVAVTGMAGSGTVIATVGANKANDAAGNGNAASTSTDNTVTYDVTAPTVVSISRAGASAAVNSGPLSWTVTFSEPVNGATVANFALATSGVGGTAPSITSATAIGGAPSATWTVSVSTTGATGTNSGSIGLNLANTNNVKDVANNNLSATTPVVGEAYTYDTTAPTVTLNQAATQSDPTNAAHVNFTVTFSESVTGFSAANVTLGGTAGATTVVVSGSGTTYNVSVGGMTASGTVTASVTAGSAQDAAGNQAATSTSSDNSVQFTATIIITSPTENQSSFSRTGPFTGTGAPATSTVTVEFCQAATFTSACEATPSASFTVTSNASGVWTLTLTSGQQLNNNVAYSMRATATTGTKSSVVRHFHT